MTDAVPGTTEWTAAQRTGGPSAGPPAVSAQQIIATELLRRADAERKNLHEWAEKVQNLQAAMTALMKVPGTDDMRETLRQRLAQDKSALKYCQGRSEAYTHAHQIAAQRRHPDANAEPCPKCGALDTYATDYDQEGQPRGIGCHACGYDSDAKGARP